MRLSEISPSSIKIDRLLNRISEGDIKIPAFQRGFVWTQEQVIKLLDSIYNDYPIGSILLWNSSEKLTSTRNIAGFLLPDREPQYPINYILDGQQRLSAIYAVFSKDREKAPVKLPYSPDPAIFDLYFDLDEENIVAEKDIKEEHKYLKMNTLFDVNAFYEELNKFNKENKKQAQLVLSKFQNYEIPIVTTTKRKKEDVGNIFERINHTGTTLSTLDLMIAWTWSENFHLREEINDIKSKLDDKGFGDTDEKIILQCLGGIIDKTAKTKDILALKPESVRTNIELLKSSLEKTIDFLATEINIASSDFLPHSHQIVPLAFLFSRVNMPSQEQIKVVKQWFWKTSFSNRYAGSTDTKMNEDISFFEKVANNDFSDMVKYSYSIDRNSLIDQVFSKSNPFTRAFLLLLAQKNH